MKIANPAAFWQQQFAALAPPEIVAHSRAVAAGCQQFAQWQQRPDAAALFVAGLVHDLGKSPELLATGWHPVDGARYLQQCGEEDLAQLAARHATSVIEAELLDYCLAPWEEERLTVEQAILDAVDLTTDSQGRPSTFQQRQADIVSRYPADSAEVRSLSQLTARQWQYIDLRQQLITQSE